MCMPRIFGVKLVEGKKENKKKPVKSVKREKKIIHQSKVEFE